MHDVVHVNVRIVDVTILEDVLKINHEHYAIDRNSHLEDNYHYIDKSSKQVDKLLMEDVVDEILD